jgi:hypothetical protein
MVERPTEPASAEPARPEPLPAATPERPAPSGGFFQNLVDLYFAPRDAFTRIVSDPRWLWPAIAFVAVTLGFLLFWLSRIDAMEFARTTLQESAFWDRIPPEQRAQVIEQTAGRMKFAWINGLVFGALWLVVVSAVLMFVFRFFYAGEVTFKRALAIVAWTSLAVSLVTVPLTLAVLGLKGDWNLDPNTALQANVGALLDKDTIAKPLWALATSLDLLSFWQIFLLATGFAVASRKKTGAALWGVVVPWALIVLVKVGWAAIF